MEHRVTVCKMDRDLMVPGPSDDADRRNRDHTRKHGSSLSNMFLSTLPANSLMLFPPSSLFQRSCYGHSARIYIWDYIFILKKFTAHPLSRFLLVTRILEMALKTRRLVTGWFREFECSILGTDRHWPPAVGSQKLQNKKVIGWV